MKTLGVIVPVYNKKFYLRDCIDSILCQSYRHMCIVLVDDGSTDGSGDICDAYAAKDNRIFVLHQVNQGPIRARYHGLMACDADYISFIDADDYLEADAYLQIEEFMEQNVDMVVFENYFNLSDGREKKSVSNYPYGFYDRERIQKEIFPTMIWDDDRYDCGISTSLESKVVKKRHYVREYEKAKELSFQFGEDSLILLPLMQHVDSIQIVDKYLTHFRIYRDEPAPYISCGAYFDNAYSYYCHLRQEIIEYPGAKRQLEYLYTGMVEGRKRYYYRDYGQQMRHLFPFGKVEYGSAIILYGAGKVGQTYYDQIRQSEFCEILAWIDKNPEKYESKDVCGLECLGEINNYKHIVIGIESEEIVSGVVEELQKRGISKDKIIT